MVVLDPILVTIVNLADDFVEPITVYHFAKTPERGSRIVTLTNKIYVDRQDIQLEDHEDFWGIAPGKMVGIKYCGAFKV